MKIIVFILHVALFFEAWILIVSVLGNLIDATAFDFKRIVLIDVSLIVLTLIITKITTQNEK